MSQNYPADKFEVQIIDDSPLCFPDLILNLTDYADLFRIDFKYINRPSRKGFKSGALNYGMRLSRNELIVIIDADFILRPNFLLSCVPAFNDKDVAGVQTRWTYRNHFENEITTLQATIFETIFGLEQRARIALNFPALFTGTSGIVFSCSYFV